MIPAGGWGERGYRDPQPSAATGRVAFNVREGTSDLFVRCDRDLAAQARDSLRRARGTLEAYIRRHPAFATALTPLDAPPGDLPAVVELMYRAANQAGVGPMAAVAGTLAAAVGRDLATWSREVFVENGGDIYLDVTDDAVVGILSGSAAFEGRLALRIPAASTPLGVCTSAGTVGPSLSYGRADAATVVAGDAALADAVATALGNRIAGAADLEPAVRWAVSIGGVRGAVAVAGEHLAAMGELEFVEV